MPESPVHLNPTNTIEPAPLEYQTPDSYVEQVYEVVHIRADGGGMRVVQERRFPKRGATIPARWAAGVFAVVLIGVMIALAVNKRSDPGELAVTLFATGLTATLMIMVTAGVIGTHFTDKP